MSGQLCLKWNNHANAFNKLLNQIFLEDGNGYSDVTILCHGKFYPVHRFVLSTCSEYFEEMFQQCIRLNNKHPFIIVKDIHPEQMEALLNYMYKGEVNVPQEHLPELIKAAEAFKIKGLAVPDEDELSAKKKRNASSRSLSPEPKRSKNNEHLESTETENNSESSETSNFIAESFCEPLISEIKCEPLVTISEDFPVIENTNSEVMPDITKEEEIYSSSKSFDFGTSVQYQQQQESESQWNEDFQSFEEGEGSQEDSNNRPLTLASFQQDDYGLSANNKATKESFASCSFDAGIPELKKLIRSQKGAKVYKCEICSYRCTSGSNLTIHLRSHTGEKPYTCTFSKCDYKASTKPNLNTHMRIHTGDRPFTCDQCSYKATRKYHLNEHMRIHTGEILYCCNQCSFKAAKKSTLTKHMRTHTL